MICILVCIQSRSLEVVLKRINVGIQGECLLYLMGARSKKTGQVFAVKPERGFLTLQHEYGTRGKIKFTFKTL